MNPPHPTIINSPLLSIREVVYFGAIKVTFIKVKRLTENDNGKTLAEMGFKNDETLTIYKKTNLTSSKMPLLTPENKINARAKATFT